VLAGMFPRDPAKYKRESRRRASGDSGEWISANESRKL
jgi:hypothetical protein